MDKAFKIAVMLSAYDKLSTVVNSAVDKSERKLKGFQKSTSHFAEKMERGMILGEGGKQFLESSIAAAEESEIAEKRLKQVFKSMGEQNDEAAEKALAYANTLQFQIGIEDEVIAATQAKIATFKSVSNEAGRMAGIFDRATAAAFDMQATGFGDASSNAVQLGKALEDPIKGITALRRSGITFTDAEKSKIKVLVEGNKKLDAQKLILKAVEKQVGGVSKATATTASKAKVSWSEVMETIGKHLLPVVNQLATFLTSKVIPAVKGFIEKNPVLVKVLGAVSVALLAVGSAARVVSFILSTNPIVLIITAIATAAYLIYDNWGAIKKWFINLWEGIKNIFKKTWEWIKHMFLNYTPYGLIIKHWDKIKAWFSNLWQWVKNIFLKTWEWIKNMFLNYTPHGLIIKHWDKIVAFFRDLWDKVKNIFSEVWQWIKDQAKKMYEAGKELLKELGNGIKEGFKNAFGIGVQEKAQKMMDQIKAAIKKNPLEFDTYVRQAHAAGLSFDDNALRNELLTPATPVSNTTTKSVNQFAPVINYSGPGGPAAGQQIGNDVVKLMKDYNDNKKRVSF